VGVRQVSDVNESATDVVADVIEERAEVVGEFVRNLNTIKLSYAALGAAAGAAAGALIAYKVAYAKASMKYDEIAQEEIQTMREHYQAKVVADENEAGKASLDDIVKEQGYAGEEPKPVSPPMAVTPPVEMLDDDDDDEEDDRPSESLEEHRARIRKEAAERDPQIRNIFEEAEHHDEWDYAEERRRRSPLRPYVIHVDEKDESSYVDMTLTYYEIDDVLCRDDDTVLAGKERDDLIGEGNLNLFGHGSNDASIVYVRNDQMELDLEIVRSPNSFAQEVHGFDPPETEIRHGDKHRGRHSYDDE
jgi:hypothetical protein